MAPNLNEDLEKEFSCLKRGWRHLFDFSATAVNIKRSLCFEEIAQRNILGPKYIEEASIHLLWQAIRAEIFTLPHIQRKKFLTEYSRSLNELIQHYRIQLIWMTRNRNFQSKCKAKEFARTGKTTHIPLGYGTTIDILMSTLNRLLEITSYK